MQVLKADFTFLKNPSPRPPLHKVGGAEGLKGGAFHGGGHLNLTPDNKAKLGVGRIPLKTSWPAVPDGYTPSVEVPALHLLHFRLGPKTRTQVTEAD